MQFDEIFQHVGDLGPYQILVLLLLMGPEMFSDTIGYNFISARMDHWCAVPELHNLSSELLKLAAIPPDQRESGGYQQCAMYDLDYAAGVNLTQLQEWVNLTQLQEWGGGDGNLSRANASIVACRDGWQYDRSQFTETTVSAFDLVCSHSYLAPLPGTMSFFGAFFGAPLSGILSDRLGRRRTSILYFVLFILGGGISTIAPSLWIFCVGRAITGFGNSGYYLCCYVTIMEMVGPKYRGTVGPVFALSFTMTYFTNSFLGYFLRHFRFLMAATTCPRIAFIFIYLFVPESPRWLIQNNRLVEADKVFRKMANFNSREIPENFTSMLEEIRLYELEVKANQVKKKNVVTLYRSKVMLPRALALDMYWIVGSMIYYSIALNVGSLAGNLYLNLVIMGAVDLPAMFLSAFLVNTQLLGRRLTVSSGMVLAGIFAGGILTGLILLDGAPLLLTVMAILGKLFMVIGFEACYVFTTETYPTEVRQAGLGVNSMVGRVGGIIAPYMGPPMADIWEPLPSIISGVCALFSGLFVLIVPETLGQPMLQTLEEAELRKLTKTGSRPCRKEVIGLSEEMKPMKPQELSRDVK